MLQELPELKIYLEFPGRIMVKKKNNRDKYKKIERFETTLYQYVV